MHVIQSSVPMSAEDALAGYNQLILPTRVRFARSRGVQEMTSPEYRRAHDGSISAAFQRSQYPDDATGGELDSSRR